jgi:NADH-quinone oxidoreductase subunit J
MEPIWIDLPKILFLVLAGVAVACGLSLILQRNPIYSALSLIGTLCAVAALYLTLATPFIAAIQIIVYAGAIMVLFVFVIMLLNVRAEESKRDPVKYLRWLAAPLVVAIFAEVYFIVKSVQNPPAPATVNTAANAATVAPEQVFGTTESIGHAMFTEYLYPFEATSVLILMAIVGAMVLARKWSHPTVPVADARAAELPEGVSGDTALQAETEEVAATRG